MRAAIRTQFTFAVFIDADAWQANYGTESVAIADDVAMTLSSAIHADTQAWIDRTGNVGTVSAIQVTL